MSQTAAHLVDQVILYVAVHQWVLTLPIALRLLLAAQPELVTPVLQTTNDRAVGPLPVKPSCFRARASRANREQHAL